MLDKIIETSKYVMDNSVHVSIDYEKLDQMIKEFEKIDTTHYFAKLNIPIINENTETLINFLLIYDSINYSFWGNPKWSVDGLDGGIALLYCLYNTLKNNNNIFNYFENITLEEFKTILKGNVEIPLIKERYTTVKEISKIVNNKMNGNFYNYIKNINNDKELFELLINSFPSFYDERDYKQKTVYFYKLAQLLTADILQLRSLKENVTVKIDSLVGCADYKIPQVLNNLGILRYTDELQNKLIAKKQIEENSSEEIEIRASMLVVIEYIYNKFNKKISRIDINNYLWLKGKNNNEIPYHLTRTINY